MTRQPDGSVLYAVYGTLRKGHGNHRYLLDSKEGVEFLGEIKTEPRFKMYSMGGFPGVAEGGDKSIVVEIYRVTDEATIRGVNGLEGYSGVRGSDRNWYDTCEIQTPWGVANMFTQNALLNGNRPEIVTGDWNNR